MLIDLFSHRYSTVNSINSASSNTEFLDDSCLKTYPPNTAIIVVTNVTIAGFRLGGIPQQLLIFIENTFKKDNEQNFKIYQVSSSLQSQMKYPSSSACLGS